MNVDTPVAEKAIAFPADVWRYHKMRLTLVHKAQRSEIKPRQRDRRLGKRALIGQGHYVHAH